jgi:hypothetical protein
MSNDLVGHESAQKTIVNLAVDLDKDDLAAILLARAEVTIKNNITACKHQDEKLRAVRKELEEDQRVNAQKAAEAAAAKTVELLTAAADTLDAKRVDSSISVSNFQEKNGTIAYKISVVAQKPTIQWLVIAEVKASAEVKATWKAIAANEKEQHANNITWVEHRRKLQDLPSLERRARAAVAEQRLTRSAEGVELLALLDSQVADGIKLLGIS